MVQADPNSDSSVEASKNAVLFGFCVGFEVVNFLKEKNVNSLDLVRYGLQYWVAFTSIHETAAVRSQRSTSQPSWSPLCDFAKINFDATTFAYQHREGLGMPAQSPDGSFIMAKMQGTRGAWDSNTLEALALHHVVQWAREQCM